MKPSSEIQERAINAIRFLSLDTVRNANSGHPGLPTGTAAIAYTIWTRHLKHNPLNPRWGNRDRFILSGGHGSALLYSLLYLSGYSLSLDDLKSFRKWGSITPGHPEFGVTPGVETTTGPLGQGFSNGVGMAIAETHLASIFNKPDYAVLDHHVYGLVTDGDLMEGVSSEAASLAGHLKLGKIIYLYDDNRISIDGTTEIAFTEDRMMRFDAYGWHTQVIDDGNDVDAIDEAIKSAKSDQRPSIIACRTHIGYGLPNLQDSPKAHGEPPPQDEIDAAKDNMGWPKEPMFFVPDDVLSHYRASIDRGKHFESQWNRLMESYESSFPELSSELIRRLNRKLPDGWEEDLPLFPADRKGMSTRAASGKVINAISSVLPEIMGGSADLAPSNKTWIDGLPAFQAKTPEGRNMYFGVREHGMGAIMNGMAYHGGIIPYGGTFLVFSDYMRGAIRVAALSHLHLILVFTHDSIGVGEDGPTHQPVEQVASLRAIPGLVTIRPSDSNETSLAWKYAIQMRDGPTALILSRHSVPTIDRGIYSSSEGLMKGAYVLSDLGSDEPDIVLMASGTEVSLIISAGEVLFQEGMNVRLVSFPSWEIFASQEDTYQKSVLLPNVKTRLAVEAGSSMGWRRWVGDYGEIISVDRFGASAPQKILYDKYGLTVQNIVGRAKDMLKTETKCA